MNRHSLLIVPSLFSGQARIHENIGNIAYYHTIVLCTECTLYITIYHWKKNGDWGEFSLANRTFHIT